MHNKSHVEELRTEFKHYLKPQMIKPSFIRTCLLFPLSVMNLSAWNTFIFLCLQPSGIKESQISVALAASSGIFLK